MEKKFIFFILVFLVLAAALVLFFPLDTFGIFKYGGKASGTEEAFCYDTDDGQSYYERAMVYGRSTTGADFKFSDSCKDENRVQEWYCNNLEPDFKYYECPKGCFNGVCQI
jgi:hypothetical protein